MNIAENIKDKTGKINGYYRIVQALVEGGTFMIGSESGEDREKPVQSVIVSSFYIARYQITQKLWKEVMGNNPSKFKGDNLPVEQVRWYDAVEYCNKLSRKDGLNPVYTGSGDSTKCNFNANGYRLPTEAEWEFAARGGNSSRGYKYSGSNNIGEIAWYKDNSKGKIHPIGEKQVK